MALLRHPLVRTLPNRCYGRTDLPLLDGWEASLAGLTATLAADRPVSVRTSPLSRCLLPAQALGGLLKIPVHVDPRLIELDFGKWDGLDWDDVPRASLDLWAADPLGFAAPGGESGAMLVRRVEAVCADIRAEARDCLIVSHGGPLRLLAPMLRGEVPDLLASAPAMGSIEIVSAIGLQAV
ncbi:MAG: histidine phosphatase family protein [Janthinobacterium lividum]